MNIYVYNKELQIPEDETCYIVAKGGIYLKKKLDLIESLTPVDKISFLEDIPNYAKLNIPKIPKKLFGDILFFFREVYKQYKSEAVVLLYYNKNKKSFKVHVPEQEVSHSSVSYTGNHTIKGFILIGSIHSHSSMTAFHSGVDTNDEEKFDGIHFTFGKLDEDTFFDLCSSIAINGLRVQVDPTEYVNGLEFREYTNYFPNMFRPLFDKINGEKIYKNNVKTNIGYIIDGKFSFNPVWMERIKEKKYTYEYGTNYGYARYIYKDGSLIRIEGTSNNVPVNTRADSLKQLTFGFKDKNSEEDPCKKCLHNKINRNNKRNQPEFRNMKDQDRDIIDYSDFDFFNYEIGG